MLGLLGGRAKSLDEIAARTGLRKDRLAKVIWHLQQRGWIGADEEVRRLPVFRRLRELPPPPRIPSRAQLPPHVAALNAAFKIGFPARRARGRMVRRGE